MNHIAETFAELASGVHHTQLLNAGKDKQSIIEFFEQMSNDPVLDELLP